MAGGDQGTGVDSWALTLELLHPVEDSLELHPTWLPELMIVSQLHLLRNQAGCSTRICAHRSFASNLPQLPTNSAEEPFL